MVHVGDSVGVGVRVGVYLTRISVGRRYGGAGVRVSALDSDKAQARRGGCAGFSFDSDEAQVRRGGGAGLLRGDGRVRRVRLRRRQRDYGAGAATRMRTGFE